VTWKLNCAFQLCCEAVKRALSRQQRRTEVAKMRFLRAVAGFKPGDKKCNENIRQEL
jgi:hypothetical protein